MTATQAMTGQGGWPMTVFATPDGEPFYCGTYYPRDTFVRLVRAVVAGLARPAGRGARAGRGRGGGGRRGRRAGGSRRSTGSITAELLDAAATSLRRHHDPVHGGFGDAPKFPPHMALLFLLRHHQRTGDAESLEIARHTGEAMARGGLYDQLAGGFARYSVDETMARAALREDAVRQRPPAARVHAAVAAHRRSAGPAGGPGDGAASWPATSSPTAFASSLDADTGGVEGATYVWTPAQLRRGAGRRGRRMGGRPARRHRRRHVRARHQRAAPGPRRGRRPRAGGALGRRTGAPARGPRSRARSRRGTTRSSPPGTGWPSRPWSSSPAGRPTRAAPTGPPPACARRAAADPGRPAPRRRAAAPRVPRRRGRGAGRACWRTTAAWPRRSARCTSSTGEGRWLELAGQLLDTALERFGDGNGGFFDTADDAERLVSRPADPTDNATPSGLSSMAAALDGVLRPDRPEPLPRGGRAGAGDHRTGDRDATRGSPATPPPWPRRWSPVRTRSPSPTRPGDSELARAAWRLGPARRGRRGRRAGPGRGAPAGRAGPLIDGRPTAYVCRGFVCDRPVTTRRGAGRGCSPEPRRPRAGPGTSPAAARWTG